MPTKKPILQSVVTDEIYNKFIKIAEKERRSKSQLTSIAIEQYIKTYEEQNGKIEAKNINMDIHHNDNVNINN